MNISDIFDNLSYIEKIQLPGNFSLLILKNVNENFNC